MSVSLERKVGLSLAVGLAVLLALGTSAWWSAARFLETIGESDHIRKIQLGIERTLGDLMMVETCARGYLLRGDELWLEQYREGLKRLPAGLRLLRADTAAHAGHQERLKEFDQILARELEMLETRVRTFRQGGLSAVLETTNTPGDGRIRVARMRGLLGEIESLEAARFARHSAETEAVALTALITVGVTMGLALCLAAGATTLLRRDFRLRREIERQLRQSEERLRLMIESARDYALILLAPDGTIARWNGGCERITGYPEAEIVGQPFARLYPPVAAGENGARQHLEAAATAGHVEAERWLARRDGGPYWADLVITPVREQRGGLVGFAALVRDLTARKHAEEKIQRQNHQLEAVNRELKAFAYSISHDLRSPLRGIDGWSLAIVEDYRERLDERGRGYLAHIRGETQRMGQLIDDLLNLSRVSQAELKPAPVDLSAVAETIVARLREQSPKRQVQCGIAPGLQAQGDPGLLRALLTNLLENAWKFTGRREGAEIKFFRTDQAGECVFCVRDNGAGFDMAYAGRLFSPFHRMHKVSEFPGTGVGLATVQRIVARHGGRIWAEARPGEGAAFFFTLNVAAGFSSP